MQPEPQPERRAVSKSRPRNPKAQPDQPPTQSKSRRKWKGSVLQAPGGPPAEANQQGAQPSVIPPAAPDKPRYTADTTWCYNKFFRNRPGPEPTVPPPPPPPPPTSKQNQRQLLSSKPNKQHSNPRKPLPAHPSKTLGRAHG
ncbi:MAG: hypothetical protein ACKPKO_06700, partial [Candidatus Fonsibacter sp.]